MEKKQEKINKSTVVWLMVIVIAILISGLCVKYVKVSTEDIINETVIETDENVINLTEVNMTVPEYINLTYENEIYNLSLNNTNIIEG